MILFKPAHVPMILDGTKTQTRRLWEKARVRVGAIHQARTQLFNGDPFARLRITALRREPLSEVTEKDVKREGYPDRASYFAAFHRINRTDPDTDPKVWVVDFEVVP